MDIYAACGLALDRIRELEDALLYALGADARDRVFHLFNGDCPDDRDGTEWQRDESCPACQRLERLLGHRRRPAS